MESTAGRRRATDGVPKPRYSDTSLSSPLYGYHCALQTGHGKNNGQPQSMYFSNTYPRYKQQLRNSIIAYPGHLWHDVNTRQATTSMIGMQ